MIACLFASQAHKLHDNIHDIELSTEDARTVGEVTFRPYYPVAYVILGVQIKRRPFFFAVHNSVELQ